MKRVMSTKNSVHLRFTAFMLMLSMLVSAFPGIPGYWAQASEPEYVKGDEVINLNFDVNVSHKSRISKVTADMGGWVFSSEKSSEWMQNNVPGTNSNFQMFNNGVADGMRVHMNPTYGDLALEFTVPKSGYYDMAGVIYGCVGYSNKINISVETNGQRTVVKNLELSGLTGSEGSWAQTELPQSDFVYLNEGKAYLILTGVENHSSGMNNLIVNSITLTEYVERKPAEPELKVTLNNSAAFVGEKTDFKAFIIDSTGKALYAQDLSGDDYIAVVNSNPRVASLENGIITALVEGTTTLTVNAEFGGKSYEKTVDFKVITIPEAEFKLVADKPFDFSVGKKRVVFVQGTYSNIVVDLEKATDVSVQSSDEKVVTVSVVQTEGKIKVTAVGIGEGTADVTVKATYNGISAETVIPLTVRQGAVAPAVFDLNFSHQAYENLKLYVHGLEPDRDKTDPAIFERKETIVYYERSMKAQLFYGEELYLNFLLPQSGVFALDFKGEMYGQLGFTAAFYIDEQFVGEYDFNKPNGDHSETQLIRVEKFRNIALEEGVHSLKIKRVSKDGANFMWMMNLIFTPVADFPEVVGISTVANKTSFAPGETVENSFAVRMSDGRDYFIPQLTENQGKLSVDNLIPERMEYNNGIAKAKKAGKAIIKIDASVPEENGDVTAYWQADIADGQLFDFTNENEGSAPTANVYEDGWSVNYNETTVVTSGKGFTQGEKGLNATFADGQVLAIDVNVEKDGAYNVDALVNSVADAGCVVDVYVGDKYLGRVDFTGDSATTQLNTVELKAGINTIYIKKVGGAEKILLQQIAFISVDKMPAPSHVTLTAESSEIEINKTMQTTAKIWMDDGREFHVGPRMDGSADAKNCITYSVSPTGVFSADANGLLKGDAIGTATLTATATVDGNELEPVSCDFSVVHVVRLFTDANLRIIRGETVEAVLTGTFDDAPIDIAQASEFTVIASDYRVSGNVEVVDGKAILTVNALRGGDSSITVEATYNGVVGSATFPVIITIPSNEDDVISLEFTEGKDNVPKTPQQADINTHGWEVNEQASSPNTLNPGDNNYIISKYGLKTVVRLGEQYAIDVWVKKAGNYAVSMVGSKVGAAGINAGIYIDGKYVGEYNFSHPTSELDSEAIFDSEQVLNSIYLDAGRHTFALKKLATSRPNQWEQLMFLSGLNFVRIDADLAFDYVKAQAGKELLAVGESTEFAAQAVMTDASVRFMEEGDENNFISVVSSAPEVAAVENGRIVAKSQGQATINVSAMVDGVEKVAFIDIIVDDAQLTAVEATADKNVYVGKSVPLSIKAYAGERELDMHSVVISAVSNNPEFASVDGTTVTGVAEGTATITVTAELNNVQVSCDVEVVVSDDGIEGFDVKVGATRMRPGDAGTQITVEAGSFHGVPVDLANAEITYTTDVEGVVSIDENGYITPVAVGEVNITVNVKSGSFDESKTVLITVTQGKIGRSYYTDERIANARENIEKYDWAKSEMQTAVANAEVYIENADKLWDMVTTQELPRGAHITLRWDPNLTTCRYCNTDIAIATGDLYAWIFDPFNSPWKIQCPACRRKFPSNDFGSFYKLGIDEHGNWDYELAKQKNAEIVANGGKGYLVNILYPEIASVPTVNLGQGLSENETVEGWGVDDGFGYKTGKTYPTSEGVFEESHVYISMYNKRLFWHTFEKAMINVGKAYMYTGDIKYGRAGAILLDRIADVYPDMDVTVWWPYFHESDSTSPFGRIEGCIWECNTIKWYIDGYDMFYPAFDDPYVINYLAEKSEKYNMDNPKTSGNLIRENIENNLIKEIFQAIKDGDIYGNFGMHQVSVAKGAVVLDSMPETKEMIDYLMAKDEKWWKQADHTGGDVLDNLINNIDRDGGTGEGLTQNYSTIWVNNMSTIADILNGYEGYPVADMYKHPKFQKAFENPINLIQVRNTTAAIGDSGSAAGTEMYPLTSYGLIRAFRASGNPKLAQLLYLQNGNKVDGLCEDIFTKNPEGIQNDIRAVIEEHGEFDFDASLITPAAGYAILRDGSLYGQGGIAEKNNQRDFWMMFGYHGTHGHPDVLNLGIHAYGIDFAPDPGYPTQNDGTDMHMNWYHSTIMHNTVSVNDAQQNEIQAAGNPLHFDDAGIVKVMDVDAPDAYDATDIYRRTVVMVEVDDDIGYGVDFFRVKGGTEHLYSFHAQSDSISSYAGFTPIDQGGGTYAGEGIAYETKGIANGYSYLTDVLKAENPGVNEFYVDFDIQDYKNLVSDNKDMHLRLTMLNDFELSEISFARGENARRYGNQPWYTYLLARHSSRDGSDIDTTFTTVLEPYKGERYIKETRQVEMVGDDAQGDVARAIRVELENGRVDYVIYAANNNVRYIVDNKLVFRGFAGVCSYNADGQVIYTYVNDGTELTDISTQMGVTSRKDYTGEVVSYTKGVVMDNYISVAFDGNVTEEELKENVVGRFINIENDGVNNAFYEILDINESARAGVYDIYIGNTTLVRSGTDVTLTGGNYVYNIAPQQWFNISLSASYDSSPVFVQEDGGKIAAGKNYVTAISAASPIGNEVTLSATALPRGATFDEASGKISWTPDAHQIGKHHFAIEATDGDMSTTLHFEVEVFKSSSGSGSAGGGGSTTPSTPSTPSVPSTPSTDDDESDAPATPAEKFIDLGNHTWAKDAIYRLVDKGVVNGTSENTYSPAVNIKRADFAIMLVRAFGITEGEGENFADVDANKYYAEELRLAKAAGIVNGVGENKFNPEGQITRQDMMLMLSRALDAVEYELSEADRSVLADFADAAEISDYAADAVSRVVKDGIIAGANGKINPKANATRAEVAVMLDRVFAEK